MTTSSKLSFATLTLAVVVLAIALFASMANGDGHQNDQGYAYAGMMMDDEAFAWMQEHLADHQSMPTTGDEDMDAMMHHMMDGTMGHMMGDETGSPNRHGGHHPAASPAQ